MNCQEFWNTMPELHGTAADAEAAAHERECPACAALLLRQQALTDGLRTVAAENRQLAAPDRLEARLVSAFRAQSVLVVRRAGYRWWAPAVAWAAAAMVMCGLGLLLVHGRPGAARSVPSNRPPAATLELADLETSAVMDADQDGNSLDGDFIPLPNAAQIGPNEEINLVRLEVPRSAMIALGFAVSADRASEPVEADVMMGADGLARAVRFITE
jgi:hypothetical protein